MIKSFIAIAVGLASCTPDTHPPIFAQPVDVTYRHGDTIPNIEPPTVLNFLLPSAVDAATLCDQMGGLLTTATLCTHVDY